MQKFNLKNTNFAGKRMKKILAEIGPKQTGIRIDEYGRQIKIYEPGLACGYEGRVSLQNSKEHRYEILEPHPDKDAARQAPNQIVIQPEERA